MRDLPQLVFFSSAKSGPARRMESSVAYIAHKERGRVRVRTVDVDAHPRIARKFGVAEVPTLVLVLDRAAVARIDGRASTPQIERLLEEHLPLEEPVVA